MSSRSRRVHAPRALGLPIGQIPDTLNIEVNMPVQSLLPTATVHASKNRRSQLRRIAESGASVQILDHNGERVNAPELEQVLRAALASLATGNDIVVLAANTEVTPTEAGKILGLSRQYIDRLIDLGDLTARTLPHSTHRRLTVAELTRYQQQRNLNRKRIRTAVNELIDAGATY
jgi:hypothetical protein